MSFADAVCITVVIPGTSHTSHLQYTQLVKMRLVLEGTAREPCGEERALYFDCWCSHMIPNVKNHIATNTKRHICN